MKISKAVIILSILVGIFAIAQSAAGLFISGGPGPFEFTTLRGETVLMSGQGLYALDTFFKAPIFRGTDALTLFVCVPLLIIALILYRGGTMRGKLFLTSILSFFLYNSISVAMGVTYNNFFLLYIFYFSVSLFAFFLAAQSIDLKALASSVSPGFPRKGIAILLFVAAAALLFAWLGDILTPLFTGSLPKVTSYTTDVTYAVDLGVIAPVCIIAGIQLLRRKDAGYLLSSILLMMLAVVGLMVSLQTFFQLSAGITLTPGELIGKAGSFILLAVIATLFIVRFFKSVEEK
jgi:hypothetical protein